MTMKSILYMCGILISSLLATQQVYNYEGNHKIEEGKTLHLNSNDAEVTIKGTDRKDVFIEIHREATGNASNSEEFTFDIEEREGDLYISEKRVKDLNKMLSYLNIKNYTIDLFVPKNVNLKIEGDDDNYDISNINKNINLDFEDGDANIYDCFTDNINLKVDDGNINLDNVEANVQLHIEDGNLITNHCNLDDFNAKIDDGDIKMNQTTCRDTKIQLQDGDIILDKVNGQLRIGLEDGNLYVKELSSNYVDVKCEDCEIDLNAHMMDNSDYEFIMEDGGLNLNLLSGGGTIDVKCEDGDVDINRNEFEFVTNKDHYKKVKTRQLGNSLVSIKMEDGDVNLGR